MAFLSIFQNPWLLMGLAVLPALWWLLRHHPPRAKRVEFPATWVVARLRQREETPRTTPWWLLLLRAAILVFVIVGLARPFLSAEPPAEQHGPLILVVDNDWSTAPDWNDRLTAADRLIDAAEQRGVGVALAAAEPQPGEDVPRLDFGLMSADRARERLRNIQPRPWPAERAAFQTALDRATLPENAEVHWLWNGLGGAAAEAIANRLATRNRLTAHAPAAGGMPLYIAEVQERPDSLAVTLGRLQTAGTLDATLRFGAADGSTVARESTTFAAGADRATVALRLPPETFNQVSTATIAGNASAAGTFLFGDDWRRRRVGLAVAGETDDATPLTSPVYYLRKALAPVTPLTAGPLDEIIADMDALILTDRSLGPNATRQLTDWIQDGGLLLRFAGDTLAAQPDSLTPVSLRPGGREMGAAMTWDTPVPLGAFGDKSPFAGLRVPDDVKVARQVLADPNALEGAQIWATLADETPLVTARPMGDGLLVMFQVGANPEYSTLPYSGLFVEMLERVIKLAGRRQAPASDMAGDYTPQRVMDGFGRLAEAPPGLPAIAAADWPTAVPGPLTPPGFYEGPQGNRAFNLAGQDALTAVTSGMTWPGDTTLRILGEEGGADLLPPLLLLAILLAIVDIGITLLRGIGPRRTAAAAAGALFACLLVPGPGQAQQRSDPSALSPEEFAVMAAGATHFAYVRSPDAASNRLTENGLRTLSATLTQRTSVEPAEPVAIDLATHDISFFPVLYWAVSPPYPQLAPEVIEKLKLYMRGGGLLIIDTGDGTPIRLGRGSDPGAPGNSLAAFIGQFATEPLARITEDHVLSRAFYLLNDFPGRWTGRPVWVSAGSNNDSVSPIIVTSHGWAAAWAMSDSGEPLVPIVPGGRTQQELAWRTGINTMMYALTGNYKSDQVHIPTLLERLGQ